MADGTSSLELLRERGERRGLDSMGDSELLALIIGDAAKRSGAAVAQTLVDRFGSVDGIGRATMEELMSCPGLGRAGTLRLKASFELGRRSIVSTRERAVRRVRGPEDVAGFMIPELRELDREHFKAVLLNTKHGILKIVTVAVGSLNAALVHPREIFKEAVAASAAGIILVHNHPTGNPEPSGEDAELTVRFVRCGELMGIDLVDHIIVGGDRFVSMRERGLIAD